MKNPHKEAIAKSRKALAQQPRNELLMRRGLVEVVIAAAQKAGDDATWRIVRTDDKLGVIEQLDLINEALTASNDLPPQTVGLQTGVVIAEGLSTGKNKKEINHG
jgi:hypothetical protein